MTVEKVPFIKCSDFLIQLRHKILPNTQTIVMLNASAIRAWIKKSV